MTLIATPEHKRLQAEAPATHGASNPAGSDTGSLGTAVQAVNEHRRQIEMRRVALAARDSQPADDWPVPVPRTQLMALEQQAREAAALRKLLDSGPVIAVPFSALPPYTLRDMPASLARAIGQEHDTASTDRPLTRLFSATDLPRLQQALFDGDAVTLVAHLRRADGHALRCSVHLSATDPADPDWRWACIVRLPQAGAGAHAQHDRLPAKPSQRPRVDVRPAPSA